MSALVARASTRRSSLRNSILFLNTLVTTDCPDDPRQALRTTIERLTKAWAIAESQNDSFLYPTPAFPNVLTGPDLQNLVSELTPTLWMVEREVADMSVKLQLREAFSCLRAESHIVGLCEVHLSLLATLTQQLENAENGESLGGEFVNLATEDLENGIAKVKNSLRHLIGRAKVEGLNESPVIHKAQQILGESGHSGRPSPAPDAHSHFSPRSNTRRQSTRKGSLQSLELACAPPSASNSEDSSPQGILSSPETRSANPSSFETADSNQPGGSSDPSGSFNQNPNDGGTSQPSASMESVRKPNLAFRNPTAASEGRSAAPSLDVANRPPSFTRSERRFSRRSKLFPPDSSKTTEVPITELTRLRSAAVISEQTAEHSGPGVEGLSTMRTSNSVATVPERQHPSADPQLLRRVGLASSGASHPSRFASVPPIRLDGPFGGLAGKPGDVVVEIPSLPSRRASQTVPSDHFQQSSRREPNTTQELSRDSGTTTESGQFPRQRAPRYAIRAAPEKAGSSSTVERYPTKFNKTLRKPKNLPQFAPIGYIRPDGYFESCTSETTTGFSSSEESSSPSTETHRISKPTDTKASGRTSPFGWSFQRCPGSATRNSPPSIRSPVSPSSFMSTCPCNGQQDLGSDAIQPPVQRAFTANEARFSSRKSPRAAWTRRSAGKTDLEKTDAENPNPSNTPFGNSAAMQMDGTALTVAPGPEGRELHQPTKHFPVGKADPFSTKQTSASGLVAGRPEGQPFITNPSEGLAETPDLQAMQEIQSSSADSSVPNPSESQTREAGQTIDDTREHSSPNLECMREARRASLLSIVNGKTSKYYNRGDALAKFLDEVDVEDVASSEGAKIAHRNSLLSFGGLELPRRESVPEEVVASLTRHLRNQRRLQKVIAASKQHQNSVGVFSCCWKGKSNSGEGGLPPGAVPLVIVKASSDQQDDSGDRSADGASNRTAPDSSLSDSALSDTAATSGKIHRIRRARRHASLQSSRDVTQHAAQSQVSKASGHSDTEAREPQRARHSKKVAVLKPDQPWLRSEHKSMNTMSLMADSVRTDPTTRGEIAQPFRRHPALVRSLFSGYSTSKQSIAESCADLRIQ